MSSMPAVFNPQYRVETDTRIRFEAIDHNDQRFYTDVLDEDFLKTVNYIVISIGDNDEAIALGIRIFNLVRRFRDDVSKLRIFVRCTDDNKVEKVSKIADHYNYGYGRGVDNNPVIHIFGEPEKTYTYDLVVSDRLIEEGKMFHEEYRRLSGEGPTWDKRHSKLTETGTPNIESLRKLRRQESQDRANALHAGTKMILLQRAMASISGHSGMPVDWKAFYRGYFNPDGSTDTEGKQSEIYYPGLSVSENIVITNLAMLEHLRWNAAHELMGYVFNPDSDGCDERTMRHNCLCRWSQLDGQSDMVTDWECDYKKYDFCVVDTTIAMNKSKLVKE